MPKFSSKPHKADSQPPRFRLGADGELLYTVEELEARHNHTHLVPANLREQRWAALAYESIMLQFCALLLGLALSAIPHGLSDSDAIWVTILTFSILPPIFPIALYFYWLNRSDYVAFHAVQAMSVLMLAGLATLINPIRESIVTSITSVVYTPPTSPLLLTVIVLPVLVVIWGWPFLFVAILAIGMIRTARGKVFLLPILGRGFEDYLQNWYRYKSRNHLSSKRGKK